MQTETIQIKAVFISRFLLFGNVERDITGEDIQYKRFTAAVAFNEQFTEFFPHSRFLSLFFEAI